MTLVWQPTLANETFVAGPETVVYPNPSTGVFNLEVANDQPIKKVQVVNVLGEVVYTKEISGVLENNVLPINLSDMSEGMYIVNVSNDNGTATHKVYLKK